MPTRFILSSHQFNIGLFAFLYIIAYFFFASTFTTNNGQLSIDAKLWSDFGAHIPMIRSFSYGDNFPPEYPTFPGEPIRYHYLFYLLVGLLEKFGVNLSIALNSLSALGLSLLLFMIFQITLLLSHSRRASFLALFLFLFNGTLSFITFFKKHPISLSSISDIINQTQFASFGPWDKNIVSAFWNLNIYTNQRHLAFGFGLSLIVIWIILRHINRKSSISLKYFLITAPIILVLPYLHQASFFITLSISIILILLHPRELSKLWLFLIFLIFLSVPGLFGVGGTQGTLVAFEPGFLSDPGINNFIIYWWFNLGLYFFLIPLVFLTSRRLSQKLFLATLPLFIVANTLRLSPDMINNHKLINFFLIIIVILTSIWLVKMWNLKSVGIKIITLILICFLTLSGLIDLFPIINDHAYEIEDFPQNQIASWIYNHTPEQSIFLTNTYLYNPASLVGRKTYLDYGYFNWSLGYNDAHRKSLLPQFFSPSIQDKYSICQSLSNEHISYILLAPGSADLTELDIKQSVIKNQFNPAFISQNGYHIYNVEDNCNQD